MRYNKKQKSAIESLVCNLDELDNKPRRLYSSLRKLAEVFIENETPEEKVNFSGVINRIDQAEKTWYDQWNFEREIADILNDVRKQLHDTTSHTAMTEYKERRKEWCSKEELDSNWNAYKEGAKDMQQKAMRTFMYRVYEELDNRFD